MTEEKTKEIITLISNLNQNVKDISMFGKENEDGTCLLVASAISVIIGVAGSGDIKLLKDVTKKLLEMTGSFPPADIKITPTDNISNTLH